MKKAPPVILAAIMLVFFSFVSQQTVFAGNNNTEKAVFHDDFSDGVLNANIWSVRTSGGSYFSETNGRLEITHPADASGNPFGVFLTTKFELQGDFDVQVDYELLEWPENNGIRVGLGTTYQKQHTLVERVGAECETYARDAPSSHHADEEKYLVHFQTVYAHTPTSDMAASLRLVRTGSTLTAFYLGAEGWVKLRSCGISTENLEMCIRSWSSDKYFGNKRAKLAFDDFQVNSGEIFRQSGEIIDNTPPELEIRVPSNYAQYPIDVQPELPVRIKANDPESGIESIKFKIASVPINQMASRLDVDQSIWHYPNFYWNTLEFSPAPVRDNELVKRELGSGSGGYFVFLALAKNRVGLKTVR